MPGPAEKARHADRLRATLLGTALGDALALPAEGMGARTVARRYGRMTRFRFLGATGFVSDDTEQAALVAQALLRHPGDLDGVRRAFRRALLGWFLRLPWGVGLATVRSCLRIAIGLSRSGVRSAGNGGAMRSAVVGAFLPSDAARRREWADALCAVTHVDPRAVEGARFVAEVAAEALRDGAEPVACLEAARRAIAEPSLGAAVDAALDRVRAGAGTAEAAAALGTSGFVLPTVAFATFCFGRFGREPLRAVQEVISGGGDTDTIGAIVGGWCGALGGEAALPADLLARIQDGPFGPTHLRALGDGLAAVAAGERPPAVRYAWPLAMLRNLALYPVVLGHGFRRLVPW